MATTIRPEVSSKNRYWISRHRYYELKHFCLQYPEWKRSYKDIDGLFAKAFLAEPLSPDGTASDPTGVYAEARLYFANRIEMVEKSARDAAGDLWRYLLQSVTEGVSYECLRARENVPCCKDVWYAAYRRFFWLLDKARK